MKAAAALLVINTLAAGCTTNDTGPGGLAGWLDAIKMPHAALVGALNGTDYTSKPAAHWTAARANVSAAWAKFNGTAALAPPEAVPVRDALARAFDAGHGLAVVMAACAPDYTCNDLGPVWTRYGDAIEDFRAALRNV